MNNKKNNLISIVIVLLILIVVGVGVVVLVNRNKSIESPNINDKEPEKELTEEEAGNMINDLYLIGLDLYDSGKYLNLPKNGSMYYVTKGKLRELGYTNIDKLVLDNCSDGHSILFFNTEKENSGLIGDPIIAVHDCSGFTIE